ncbi:MAG TPA: bifunctional UDP-N-acetylglucosamine diphosphorylase/glucosamine-1-phosphate N-acetyltransferase GlmU [Rhodospirillales bacterium]|nr:bifunctional UDP-N-acetylglucosamine diphosphorylase/glucosamine-1-phosphate N-acetyltransferase GlmU [Rhodospirillales bacterium]
MSRLAIAVLAAGRGTRMRNGLAKVLHPLAGRPLLGHVLATASALEPAALVVVLDPRSEEVAAYVTAECPGARIVWQDPPQGTGDAARRAAEAVDDADRLLVLYGDTPLLGAETLRAMIERHATAGAAATVLAFRPARREGYGRLRLAEDDRLLEIVEERHATPELRAEAPCNAGVMLLELETARALLPQLPLRPEKGEYYLTDLVAALVAAGRRCVVLEAGPEEPLGVNSQRELAELEAVFQRRRREALLDRGVIMPAPDTVFLAFDTEIGPGAVIEPQVVFGPGVRVAGGAVVRSFSHLEGAEVAAGAVVGPFARLRPGSRLGEGARVGNFVETKNAVLGTGAKANHLAYLGDATVGEGANIGAGTITCNYDGVAKHRTEIGRRAFVGSNSALVAPVRIGAEAIVGAGSTITRDVPDRAVAVARGSQQVRPGRAPDLRQRFARRRAEKAAKE